MNVSFRYTEVGEGDSGGKTPFFRVPRDRWLKTTRNKNKGEGIGERGKGRRERKIAFNSRFWAFFAFSCRGTGAGQRSEGLRGDGLELIAPKMGLFLTKKGLFLQTIACFSRNKKPVVILKVGQILSPSIFPGLIVP